ncbi:tRNA-dihydrouridine synthase [Candidatus Saccharibacteria bacterium]|nr:tRNA-dihydrouridine synthase [Candidatus Saccharibacteria bacterium]
MKSPQKTIWGQVRATKAPFFVLAPMDDVTDIVFRQVVARLASADIMMTEFANVEGFCSPGRIAIERRLLLAPDEQNVIAQIWGTDPAKYQQMASELATRPFAGIDINMGCPVRDVIKTGACSGLIRTPELAQEIIQATQKGAGEMPVSVKTRIGFNEPDIEGWIGFLLEQQLPALTIHLRTVKEQSKVPAHWELLADIVAMRDRISPDTAIIANGDIEDRQAGLKLAEQTGCDGVMIGRGVFHNPWAFEVKPREHTLAERLAALKLHLDIFEATWQNNEKHYEPLKKFFKIYIQGFDGAAVWRNHLMQTRSLDEARHVIASIKS